MGPGNLKSHKLKHSDIKRFCFGACGKLFRRKETIVKHLKRCSIVVPFSDIFSGKWHTKGLTWKHGKIKSAGAGHENDGQNLTSGHEIAGQKCSFPYSLFVTVKWLAVKTASEMTYTVPGGALNSSQSNPFPVHYYKMSSSPLHSHSVRFHLWFSWNLWWWKS